MGVGQQLTSRWTGCEMLQVGLNLTDADLKGRVKTRSLVRDDSAPYFFVSGMGTSVKVRVF